MDRGGIALWGGVECTVARVGDVYRDQVRATGHHVRADDIQRIASLGLTHVRYPVLWERVAPNGLARADWSWTDERLQLLRDRGIEPIVTLLHHGSGPSYTSLLDDEFPRKLAHFARTVARRYPWLRFFTPVNEPLTTARFCALYGIWYPHTTNDVDFLKALFNELRGVAAAMNAIREYIPEAQLVQTEDLGKTYGTEELEQQIRFENDRRWATYDILCGRVDRGGPFMQWVQSLGFDTHRATLEGMQCEPGVMGLNYYVTSERFLDHRTQLYARRAAPGNGVQSYVDVEAVRVPLGIAGFAALASECWERYRTTLALTEAQLACTREEQLRWVDELYRDCIALRDSRVDICAFTIWSIFGASDWDTCLVRQDGTYESGVFDVGSDPPRETALAHWCRMTSAGKRMHHPILDVPGWWRRDERVRYERSTAPRAVYNRVSQAVCIIGEGLVAHTYMQLCRERGFAVRQIPSARPHAATPQDRAPWLTIDVRSETFNGPFGRVSPRVRLDRAIDEAVASIAV